MRYTVIVQNDQICWYKEGTEILHREDGPAIEYANGTKYWYQNDELHREDGPAIEYTSGTKYWYQHGKHHRLDGPAIEYADGTKHWCQNGQYHRLDGPAVESFDGTKAWYLDGKEYSEAEFLKKTQPASCDGQVVKIEGVKYQLKVYSE